MRVVFKDNATYCAAQFVAERDNQSLQSRRFASELALLIAHKQEEKKSPQRSHDIRIDRRSGTDPSEAAL